MAKIDSIQSKLVHHGAVNGVTGSCHQLFIDKKNSLLVDCGLFQGQEIAQDGAYERMMEVRFPVASIRALLVTHCHIDHVGRIPYLIAAGYIGPIYCSDASAELLPLVLEDAVAVGFTRDVLLVQRLVSLIKERIVPVPYDHWQPVKLADTSKLSCQVRFRQAGHILGSAYIECELKKGDQQQRVVFSGDLGGPYTPLLPNPKPPYKADTLVLESTYGDTNHAHRKDRQKQLQKVIRQCLQNRGVVLIPAFSIGRTQELLYELEDIIHHHKNQKIRQDLAWDDLEIIVDSPLASRFTSVYKKLRTIWDQEAQHKLHEGRHPLSFEQLTTINEHQQHLDTVEYLKSNARPCVVISASGMCNGGRILNYLKALIEDPRTDILFIGYQAHGTIGRIIQQYGPKQGFVEIHNRKYDIKAGVYTISGYSAHADQQSLLRFVKGMRVKPGIIRLVHGDIEAKNELKQVLSSLLPETDVIIP